ncbi:MAG: S41 family peptidase [Planctomycetota bacterium]
MRGASATGLAVVLGAVCLSTFRQHSCSAEPNVNYANDLSAFFVELDAHYPFFDLKDIRKEWERKKPLWLKAAQRAKADAEFARIVIEAMKCLRDAHLSFTDLKVKLPPEPEFYPGLSLMPAAKNRVVVLATSPNLASTLKSGMVITKIDGQSARKLLEARSVASWQAGGHFSSPQRARFFAYRFALSGKRGDKHTIHYLDGKQERSLELVSTLEADDWPHNYHQPPALEQSAKSVWHAAIESTGYIYLRRIDESVADGVRKAIDAHAGVTSWIVDLSGNTGGGYDDALLAEFKRLTQPVAVIIDAGCISAGETVARDLVRIANARLFGETTAGSSSSKKEWAFPSGFARVRYSVDSRKGADGKLIEFNGIVPHEFVEADPSEVQAGKNSGIERALVYLRATKKPR